jgi:ABC-type Fe3+-hydroxamate transport system substrate-binding protein
MRLMRRFPLAAALLAALAFSGCGDSADSTTSPTTATTPTTATFGSRLTVNGSASRTFTVTTPGTVTAMLTNAGGPFAVVGLGLGVPLGGVANCTLSTSVNTAPGSTPQVAAAVDPGTYCVAIYDVGNLTATIDFAVTISYP